MTNQAQSSSAWPPRIVVCVGTVVLRENRALFVRQAKGQSLEGKWSIPWGVVEPGESPDNAALRETGEEGGITAEIEGLLGVCRRNRPCSALRWHLHHSAGWWKKHAEHLLRVRLGVEW